MRSNAFGMRRRCGDSSRRPHPAPVHARRRRIGTKSIREGTHRFGPSMTGCSFGSFGPERQQRGPLLSPSPDVRRLSLRRGRRVPGMTRPSGWKPPPFRPRSCTRRASRSVPTRHVGGGSDGGRAGARSVWDKRRQCGWNHRPACRLPQTIPGAHSRTDSSDASL